GHIAEAALLLELDAPVCVDGNPVDPINSTSERNEPRRVSRRLQTLRGWGHAETNEVFPGSAIARRADGRRARGRARVAVGGDHLDRREDRLYRRDAPEVGAPSRA